VGGHQRRGRAAGRRGRASLDLEAFDGNGQPVSDRWPRLTGDWTVANPLIGTFGTLDTSPAARKVVVALTRSGRVLAYRTPAPACPARGRDSWPRFHHDNANSGDYSRDAVAPGRSTGLSVSGRTLSFVSPGDDLMCGTPKRYVVVQSDDPITGADVAGLPAVPGAPAPVAAGGKVTMTLPVGVKRFVGVRAVDAAGNVGRVAVVDLQR
jgi:hypothetical protein